MSDKGFVDTNILVYAHDRSAGVKHDRAQLLLEHLWDSGQGVLSTQVLQELCVNLRRKAGHPLPAEDVRHLIPPGAGSRRLAMPSQRQHETTARTSRQVPKSFWTRCRREFDHPVR